MKKVYKYELKTADINKIELPQGAQVLTFKCQVHPLTMQFIFCIWAVVNTDTMMVSDRQFVVVGTGHRLPDSELKYIGTDMTLDTHLVLHCFEVL